MTAWGYNGGGQTTVPASLEAQRVTAIAAGGNHSLALTEDGTVTGWGANAYGQTTVPASLEAKRVTAIAAGGSHSLAIVAPASPTVTAISPAAGRTAGGQNVTITGTGLTGTTSVDFGSAPAAAYTVVSDTEITATTPAHDVGDVDVTATTPAGTSTTTPGSQFSYRPVPTLTGLSPNEGPTTGGTSVSITGTGFTDASRVSFSGIDATSYTIDSDTQVTAVAPAHAPGATHVRVRTPGGTTNSTADIYRYRAEPTITALSRQAGPLAGGGRVVITGTGLGDTTAVDFFGATPTTTYTVISPRKVAATIPPSPTGAETTRHVTITTPRGATPTTPADTYTWRAAPTVTNVAPNTGPTTGGRPITITGTGFSGATHVSFSGTPATAYTINSPTQITATTPTRPAGSTHVYIRNPGGQNPATTTDRYRYLNP